MKTNKANLSNNLEKGRRLKMLRSQLKLTVAEFSVFLDIGESTIRQWEAGRVSGLSLKGAYKIASKLQEYQVICEVNWLLEGEGSPPYIPDNFHSLLNQFHPATAKTDNNDAILQEISLFSRLTHHSIITTLIDDSMEPIFKQDDKLGGEQVYGYDINKFLNQTCIVRTKNFGTLVRKIKKGYLDNTYNLYALNIEASAQHLILKDVEIISLAPITRIWRKK